MLKLILSHRVENVEDFNNLLTDPTIGDGSNISNPTIFAILSKVFLPCFIEICKSCTDKLITAEQQKIQKLDIKKKIFTNLTAETEEGVGGCKRDGR